jgi:hypothetical protein
MHRKLSRSTTLWPYALFCSFSAFVIFAGSVDARPVRGQTAQSVHAARGGNVSGQVNRGANINRNANANINRNVNRDVNRNVNRDIHVDRDIDIDVDHDWDGGWDDHPIAAGVAFGAAAATTAAVTRAVIGSMVYTLPPACVVSPWGGYTYYNCGDVLYEPRYSGTSVTYVVINQPG